MDFEPAKHVGFLIFLKTWLFYVYFARLYVYVYAPHVYCALGRLKRVLDPLEMGYRQ